MSARERRSLGGRRAIEHALAEEAVEAVDLETVVGHTRGDDDRSRADVDGLGQGDDPLRPARGEAGDLTDQQELDAERNRLLVGSRGQLGAADASGESEVIADHRAGSRLAADHLTLDDERPQPIRRRVDRRGETRRPCSDDDDIVEAAFGLRLDAEHPRDLEVRRVRQAAVTEDHGRQSARVPDVSQQTLALVGVVRVEPVRERAALEEIPHLVTAGRPALADDVQKRHAWPNAPGPAPEDLADDGVEPLFRIAPRLQEVRIELAQHERTPHVLVGRAVAVADQHAARGPGAEIVHASEEIEAGHLGRPQVRHDQRDVLPALARLLETCQRRRRRALGQNAIVGAEPSLERRGQRRQRLRIVVDQEQDRIRHDRPDWPRGRGPSSGTHDLATRRSRRRGDARARCRDA